MDDKNSKYIYNLEEREQQWRNRPCQLLLNLLTREKKPFLSPNQLFKYGRLILRKFLVHSVVVLLHEYHVSPAELTTWVPCRPIVPWSWKSITPTMSVTDATRVLPIPQLANSWHLTLSIPKLLLTRLWLMLLNKVCPCGRSPGACGVTTGFLFPGLPSAIGWWPLGEKINLAEDYQPYVLERFSGYLTMDEIYDGPFCILYATDPKQGRRITHQILEHNPLESDVNQFCHDLRAVLDKRELAVLGVTTDGSPLYATTIPQNFPKARHQICIFHILKELNKLVYRILARYRRELKSRLGKKRGRGRPKHSENPKVVRQKKQKKYIKVLFASRALWVKRELTAAEQKMLKKLTRGQPLLRTLRELMDTVYALFDKRCRTETARRKLRKLQKRHLFKRFPQLKTIRQKLEHPNLEKALEFLDDKLLEGTSNAVERSNRRHRKMQKTIYRVRTKQTLEGRIKLDMMRDISLIARGTMVNVLHRTRLQKRQEIIKESTIRDFSKPQKKAG